MKSFKYISVLFLFLFSVSNLSAQADEARIKAKIEKAYETFSKGDLATLVTFISPDYIEHSLAPGQKAGLTGLTEWFQMMRTAYPDLQFTVNDIIINSTGSKAAVLFTFKGTNTGDIPGMNASGKSVNVQGIDFLYFNTEGKATEHWGYIDESKMMEQLGVGK